MFRVEDQPVNQRKTKQDAVIKALKKLNVAVQALLNETTRQTPKKDW